MSAGAPIPADIAAAIQAARPRLGLLASPIVFYSSIGSTNDAAASLASEGAVVIAGEQTAGRGRRGRVWFSPPGSGLYVSVVLEPARARSDPLRATTLLTIAAGVAIAEGIDASAGLAVDLKWPNDVYVSERKLAGILAEATHDTVVLGYGINLSAASYPAELRDRATSLESEIGRSVGRTSVLVETLAALARRYADLLDGRFDAILDAWRSLAPSAIGRGVRWTGASREQSGVTVGIDDHGALLVRTDAGIERIVAGEVRWV